VAVWSHAFAHASRSSFFASTISLRNRLTASSVALSRQHETGVARHADDFVVAHGLASGATSNFAFQFRSKSHIALAGLSPKPATPH